MKNQLILPSFALRIACVGVILLCISTPEARAANYTWTQSLGSGTAYDWTTASNWFGGIFPNGPGGNTDVLNFYADTTTALTGNGTVTITNVPTALTLNQLNLNGKANATASTVITIGNGSSTWTLNGTTPTVNLSGVVNGSKTLTYNVAPNLSLNGTTTFAGSGSDVFNFTGNITGASGAITKSGSSTMTLSGANSYTGATTINSGTIVFAKTQALYGGNSSNWTAANIKVGTGTVAFNVGGSGEFSSGNVTTLLTNLSTVNNNGLKAGSAIGFDTTNAGGTFTISNNITDSTGTGGGSVGVTKLGTGTLVLNGNNTYTGLTTILADTLQAVGANALGSSSKVVFGNTVVGGSITLQLRVDGGGTTAFAAGLGYFSSFSPTIDVNNNGSGTNGVIQFNGNMTNSAFGNNAAGFNVTGGNGYSLFIANVNATAGGAGTMVLNPTSAALSIGNFTPTVASSGTQILKLDGTNAANSVVGVISNGTGTAAAVITAVTKSNSSTWTLSGNNTYTGTTTVTSGTLVISGSSTGGGAYAVNSGGTLGGNGTIGLAINQNVVVAAGGKLQASSFDRLDLTLSGTGALDVSGALGSGTGSMSFTLDAPTSTVVAIAGRLNIGTAVLNFDDFTFSTTGSFAAGTYTLFGGASALTGTLGSSLSGTVGGLSSTISLSGNDVILTAAVPEPTTWALLAFSLTTVMVLRRRRNG